MSEEFHATYEHGVLHLDQPLALPDRTRVSGVVKNVESAVPLPTGDSLTPDEFERLLDGWAMPLGGKLPADFSREDIYFDHD